MRPFEPLARLPASLLLLVAFQVREAQANAQRLPIAIRKMSPDAGEKLLHEYYAFAEEEQVAQVGIQAQPAVVANRVLEPEEEELLAANSSALIPYRAPFAPHLDTRMAAAEDHHGATGWRLFQRAKNVIARLEKRQFACPTGTSDCSAIGFPYSCCQAGTNCMQITDTGLGPVGCCPDGISCTGSIACSGSQQGCPSDIGGGCCIPGFVCASIGCVQSAPVVTQTSTLISTIEGSPTTVIVTATMSKSTSSNTAPTITSTAPTTSSQTTSGPTSTEESSAISASITAGPGAPVRPTSIDTVTTPAGYCPTGFYACSAVYGGGCCQTGRDCHVTSCPSTASTTIMSGDVTIVVPVTAVPTTTSAGTCAGGWSLCPSEAGATAGCCPSGYNCGTASCFLATGSATASVAKELPGSSGAASKGVGILTIFMMTSAVVGINFGMALI